MRTKTRTRITARIDGASNAPPTPLRGGFPGALLRSTHLLFPLRVEGRHLLGVELARHLAELVVRLVKDGARADVQEARGLRGLQPAGRERATSDGLGGRSHGSREKAHDFGNESERD